MKSDKMYELRVTIPPLRAFSYVETFYEKQDAIDYALQYYPGDPYVVIEVDYEE